MDVVDRGEGIHRRRQQDQWQDDAIAAKQLAARPWLRAARPGLLPFVPGFRPPNPFV